MKEHLCRKLFFFFLCFLLAEIVCHAQPPEEKGKAFRPDDLVELVKLDSALKLDIRYATSNNFMHRPMYTHAWAFLQRDAAEALERVSHKLHKQGYGLLIFDGYRPWSITKSFWDNTPPEKHSFLADPRKGSIHNRGCAVDLSLYDLKTGKEISMPSPYDDFTRKAYSAYKGGTASQRHMRDLLRLAMESEGYAVIKSEWWHFDYKDWKKYRVSDVPFERIQR